MNKRIIQQIGVSYIPSLAVFVFYRLAGMVVPCLDKAGMFDPMGLCPNLFGMITVYHWATLIVVLPALSYYIFFKKPDMTVRTQRWEYYGLVVLWLFLIFTVVILKSALDLPFTTFSLR